MNSFEIKGNLLTMKNGKTPVVVRVITFTLALLFFLMPIAALVKAFMEQQAPTFYLFAFVMVLALMGYYMFRISLWNTYGVDLIDFRGDRITYTTHYGWFSEEMDTLPVKGAVFFTFDTSRSKDNSTGSLCISSAEQSIQCTVQIPLNELELLLKKLEKSSFTATYNNDKSTLII